MMIILCPSSFCFSCSFLIVELFCLKFLPKELNVVLSYICKEVGQILKRER